MAFVLEPSRPLGPWLDEVRGWLDRSPGFFAEKPVLLNCRDAVTGRDELAELVAALSALKIRVMGLEGADPAWLDATLPPLIAGGRGAGMIEVLPAAEAAARAAEKPARPARVAPPPAPQPAPAGLIIDHSVRSGQTIVHAGDVTIIGSVASGAEIVAGGSIHVYGTLRGRAVAGSGDDGKHDTGARIFASRFEAELVAIGGLYRTAEDLGSSPRGHMVQAFVAAGALKAEPLD
jgi:septum site-determining protein MinC